MPACSRETPHTLPTDPLGNHTGASASAPARPPGFSCIRQNWISPCRGRGGKIWAKLVFSFAKLTFIQAWEEEEPRRLPHLPLGGVVLDKAALFHTVQLHTLENRFAKWRPYAVPGTDALPGQRGCQHGGGGREPSLSERGAPREQIDLIILNTAIDFSSTYTHRRKW